MVWVCGCVGLHSIGVWLGRLLGLGCWVEGLECGLSGGEASCDRRGGRRGLGNWLRELLGAWAVQGHSSGWCPAKVFVRAELADAVGVERVASLTKEMLVMLSCSRLLLEREHGTGGMRCALACCGPKTACLVLVD